MTRAEKICVSQPAPSLLLSLDHISSATQVSQNRSAHLPTPMFPRNFMTNYTSIYYRHCLLLIILHTLFYPTPLLWRNIYLLLIVAEKVCRGSLVYPVPHISLDKKSERIALFSIPWHFLKHSYSFLLRKPGYTWEVTELLPIELFNIFPSIQEYHFRIANYCSFSKISNIFQYIKER